MAFDLDNEELKATRKDKGLDDELYEDVEVLKSIVKVHNDFLKGSGKETISEREIQAIEHILTERKQDKERIQELEADLCNANCTIWTILKDLMDLMKI